MSEDLKIPDFKNETEEAQWWNSHEDDIARAFERAAANGTLGQGTVRAREPHPQPVFDSIRKIFYEPESWQIAKVCATRHISRC